MTRQELEQRLDLPISEYILDDNNEDVSISFTCSWMGSDRKWTVDLTIKKQKE